MENENLQIDRELIVESKLYYDLQLAPQNRAPLLIAVHGYAGNKRAMMREARQLAPENFAVVALQAPHQHWREPREPNKMPKVGFAWLTNYKAEDSVNVHHQAMQSLMQNLIRENIADAAQIFLLGFSQACALNFRFAFSHPDHLRGVVGISGGIPGDWETNPIYQRADQPIFYLYGDADEFYPLAQFEQNATRLKTRAQNLHTKGYTGAHEITDEMRRDVKDWLMRQSNL